MEQYLVLMKSKHILNSHLQVPVGSFSNMWDDQAFAEDSLIWPPRSYSCTFCRREFRSAQALGGHMNVHRRDRARLKQSLINPESQKDLSKSLETQICTSYSNPIFVASQFSSPILQETQQELLLGHGDHYVETNLSMGLNLSAPNGADGDEEIYCKRRKFNFNLCSEDRYNIFQSTVLGLKTGAMEEIDLELRLGNSPNVK